MGSKQQEFVASKLESVASARIVTTFAANHKRRMGPTGLGSNPVWNIICAGPSAV
jgi:hypothetical protein